MSELFRLTEAQVGRLRPFFPKSRGRARVNDRRVLSDIIYVNRGGLMWKDAPAAYGPGRPRRSTTAGSAGAAWGVRAHDDRVGGRRAGDGHADD